MNASELVEHVRSSQRSLDLSAMVRFRRRTRSNPVGFDEFLLAVGEKEELSAVTASTAFLASLSENERDAMFRAFGRRLYTVHLTPREQAALPISTLVLILRYCRVLVRLQISFQTEIRGNRLDYESLVDAVQAHPTLRLFTCAFPASLDQAVTDSVVEALATCPKLEDVSLEFRSRISDNSIRTLSLVPTLKSLRTIGVMTQVNQTQVNQTHCHWGVIADALREDSCSIQSLHLFDREADLDASLALAGSLGVNTTVETLCLCSSVGYHDAFGVALAEALKVNRSLKIVILVIKLPRSNSSGISFSENACRAFIEMLQANHDIKIYISDARTGRPWLGMLTNPTQAAQLRPLLRSMFVEVCLNECGRGKLTDSSSHLDWINVLSRVGHTRAKHGQSLGFVAGCPVKFETPLDEDELDCVELDCLSSLLKMKPSLFERR